jgi:hypothetical protein
MSFEDSLEELMSDLLTDNPNKDESKKEYDPPLYKKWFRSKTQSGFLSIKPWFAGMKFNVDIGKTNPTGKLESSTSCFVDAVDFAAYLRSVVNGTAVANFPASSRLGTAHPESFVSYGGAMINNQPVSRIMKIQYWSSNDTVDTSAFVWKNGHFKARKADSGAFIPDMKSPISVDSIKVTRQDIVSISYLLDLSLTAHVTQNSDWYDV